MGSLDYDERRELTRYLYDLDWDDGQTAEVQDYLRERLDALGGPVTIAQAWGDEDGGEWGE